MDPLRQVRMVRRLGVVVVSTTFALMILGSWVKATGSGLSCPDWPACYGQWLPPFPSADNGGVDPATGRPVVYSQAQILYEWGHRALAMIVGFIVLAWAFVSFQAKDMDRNVRLLPLVAIGILVIQVLLGGITVLGKNAAPLTTAHLATATLFFFTVTSAMWFSYLRPTAPVEAEPEVILEERFPGEPEPMVPGEEVVPGPPVKPPAPKPKPLPPGAVRAPVRKWPGDRHE